MKSIRRSCGRTNLSTDSPVYRYLMGKTFLRAKRSNVLQFTNTLTTTAIVSHTFLGDCWSLLHRVTLLDYFVRSISISYVGLVLENLIHSKVMSVIQSLAQDHTGIVIGSDVYIQILFLTPRYL